MKHAHLTIAILVSLTATATATPVAEMKKRNAIDEVLAKAADETKTCGKKFVLAYDWAAYDALDWAGMKRDKQETYAGEQSNVVDIGKGIDQVCADKDYRAALVKVSKIVYRPTNNEHITLKATVSGNTLVLENYSFGSTRHADAYKSAIEAAL